MQNKERKIVINDILSAGHINDMLIQKYLAKGPGTHWMSESPGIGIRLNTRKPGVFIAKYRRDGKQHLVTLGALDELSLVQAQEALKRLKAGKISCPGTLTFAAFVDLYINDYACVHKKTYDDDRRRINRYLKPEFGHLPLGMITSDLVRSLHRRIAANHPRQADCVCELLRAMLNKAKKWEKLPDNHKLPTDAIDWHPRAERDVFVTTDQMPRLLVVISQLKSPSERALLLMYLLTASRKDELVNLKWSEVNLDTGVIRLPPARNKSGKIMYKPLGEWALAILKSLPQDQAYVFPGRYKNTRCKSIDDRWRQIRADAGLERHTLHDLRRTTGSWLAQSGESLHLIASILGQSTTYVTKIYGHFQQKHLTIALDKHATILEAMFNDAGLSL